MTHLFRGSLMAAVVLTMVAGSAASAAPARPKARYEFQIKEVTGDVDDETRSLAQQLLNDELVARPEFRRADDGAAAIPGLRRFSVSLKFEEFKKNLKDPRPGGRLKQLAVSSRLSIFGAELPTQKMAFSGHGESTVEAEIVERRLAEETKPLVAEVVGRSVKEAVDQAVTKLSAPSSGPAKQNRRKKTKRP